MILAKFHSILKWINSTLKQIWDKVKSVKCFLKKNQEVSKFESELEMNLKWIWSNFEAILANLKANLWIQKEEGDFVTTVDIKST